MTTILQSVDLYYGRLGEKERTTERRGGVTYEADSRRKSERSEQRSPLLIALRLAPYLPTVGRRFMLRRVSVGEIMWLWNK